MTLPTGTVTFLFTDIEGSTKLAQEHRELWESLRARHHAILQAAMDEQNGYVFQVIGDAFCAAFHTAGEALRAALQAQTHLQAEPWGEAVIRVRMGINTGKAEVQPDGQYQGYLSMSRVQRVMSVAYGGQILVTNASAELMPGELPKGAYLLDMHEHRLKGLLNPEHLWQVAAPDLPGEFPPLQSLNSIPNNLPIQLTSFIGREKEIEELRQALNNHHIVTLTGSGGTGKTRLSLQVAAEVMDTFPQGVWFLELAPVTDPALVPNSLAALLGLREQAETKRSITELVCSYLQSRKVLLVFDNCEHLIEACARFSDLLLRSCKDVKIMASSREALGVEGEKAWHVPSLSLPDPDHLPAIEHLAQYEAVRLFIDRATLVQPNFNVTKENAPALAQICARLDGIPLALELAAARTGVLSLEQIAKRLDDRFHLLTGGTRTALPRQQTLRAMIDWSYNLLSEQERLLFRRLAVFTGGWMLEAAEAVCSGEAIDADLVLDLLSQLVKKSLVGMVELNGESRYSMLETIRQYGREKLFETDEAASIRSKHLDSFIQLAEKGFKALRGPEDLLWIEKLELENDNFRTALNWSLESPDIDPQKVLQLSGALQDFWDSRGYITEGFQWLKAALEKAPTAPTSPRCRVLLGLGLLCRRLSRFNDSGHYAQEALGLARQLKHAAWISYALWMSAIAADDYEEARKLFMEGVTTARTAQDSLILAGLLTMGAIWFSENTLETSRYIEEAHQIADALGNTRLRVNVLWNFGEIETLRAHYAEATGMLQEGLLLSQTLKDRHFTAHCLLSLGRVATRQGDFVNAARHEETSLQILLELSDRLCSIQALFNLGWNAYLSGETDQAIERLQECLSLCHEIDDESKVFIPAFALGQIAASRGDLPTAKGFFLQALEAHKRAPDSPFYLVYCLEAVCTAPGMPLETAARLLGRAEALREQKGYILGPSERPFVDALAARLQSQLGNEAFASARAEGMSLTLPQAIDTAMVALLDSV